MQRGLHRFDRSAHLNFDLVGSPHSPLQVLWRIGQGTGKIGTLIERLKRWPYFTHRAGDVGNDMAGGAAVLEHQVRCAGFGAVTFARVVRRGFGAASEERSPDEVTQLGGATIAPRGIRVFNPAFDVTPAQLVSAIITERGIAYPPYRRSLMRLMRPSAESRRNRGRR